MEPARLQQSRYISSSRRATQVSAGWGLPGRKSPSVQSSTCACLSPLPPAVSMVLSWATNHKISVSGNTPGAAVCHRFSYMCQRLRPCSHVTIKTATRGPPQECCMSWLICPAETYIELTVQSKVDFTKLRGVFPCARFSNAFTAAVSVTT